MGVSNLFGSGPKKHQQRTGYVREERKEANQGNLITCGRLELNSTVSFGSGLEYVSMLSHAIGKEAGTFIYQLLLVIG